MCLRLHLTSPSAEVLLTVTLWTKQCEWFWESYLLCLSLTALIAVTCLHELEKSEISDVHYRYEITICANTYIWFLLESLRSHLFLCYYRILLFDARHLLSGGFSHWTHTSLYTAQHNSHLQMFLNILLKHNIVMLWSGKMLKQQV